MRGQRIVYILVGMSLLLFVGIFVVHGFSEVTNRINIRLSARISFLIFSMTFMASSIQYFIKNELSFWLLMNRKFLGISFGLIHIIHLIFLLVLQRSFHPVFELADTSSLVAGGGAYIFVVLMLLTSIESIKSKMSFKIWKGLHTIGMYWIAIVFFSTYFKRVLGEWQYLPLLLLLVIGFMLHFMKMLKKQS